MKITKSKLKQIIKEEIDASEELLDALMNLADKIDNLDVSIDILTSAMTGEDALSIASAQRGLGRAATPLKLQKVNSEKPSKMDEGYYSKGKCVYKNKDDSKVGCTDGPVKDYLAALYANVDDAEEK